VNTNANRNNGNGSNGNGSSRNQSNFLSYYHPDHLGSSSYVSDANGKVTEHLEYFAFGETWVEENRFGETWVEENSNTQRTPYLFTAKELDEETGLYYFGARYYDPRTSVWQSPDPILGGLLNGKGNDGVYNPRNLGLYSYAYQNPIRLVDPDGNNPGPVYVPGVFGMADYRTGNAIADNTVLAVGNTAINITNSVANVALKAVGALGDALPDAGTIQSAGMAGGPYGVMAAGVGSMAVRGASLIARLDRAGVAALQEARVAINITDKGLAHVLERHTFNEIAKFAGKSKFNEGENLTSLINQGSQHQATLQANGNFVRTFDVGRNIGIDRSVGQQTSIMTVVTRSNGDLVTAFPGYP
jgi:RHS repeat-associated protein